MSKEALSWHEAVLMRANWTPQKTKKHETTIVDQRRGVFTVEAMQAIMTKPPMSSWVEGDEVAVVLI